MIHESFTIETSVMYSDDRSKRYSLIKIWNKAQPRAAALMFNPSRANGIIGDQTVDYLMTSFNHMGYGSLEVVNLIPTINGKWEELSSADLNLDLLNFKAIEEAMSRSMIILLAWGAAPFKKGKLCYGQDHLIIHEKLQKLITQNKEKCKCLGKIDIHPMHPRFFSINTPYETLKLFNWTVGAEIIKGMSKR